MPPGRHQRTRRRAGEPAPPPPARPAPTPQAPAQTWAPARAEVPGAWGWRTPGAGRAAYVLPGATYQATSVQICGLYPYVQGAGVHTDGVPMGRHLFTAEPIGVDPGEWLRRGQVTNTGIWVQAQPGAGKALAVDTPIPTATGWSRMGDLQPGDRVFDEHGHPTTVVAVSEVMRNRECWELVFSDDSRIVADADHLWVTETVADRQRGHAARLRPPARRPLGTPAEIDAVAAALAACPAGATTSVLGLARDLSWSDDRRRLLQRWAATATPSPVAPQSQPMAGRQRWDRRALLAIALEHLRAPLHDQRACTPAPAPVTTRQLAATLRADGKTNHAIPVAAPLHLDDVDLPIPPRLLGLWLGDGTSTAAQLTTADPELAEEYTAAGWRVRRTGRLTYQITRAARTGRAELPMIACAFCQQKLHPTHPHQRYCSRACVSRGRAAGHPAAPLRHCADCRQPLARTSIADRCAPCGRLVTLAGRLRAVGVLGDKHIPTSYLRASIPQRRALLSGLLDTDGTVAASGQVQYTSTSARLAADVYDLVGTLGYRATLRQRPARLDGREVGTAYTVGFTTTSDDVVFGLQRKRAVHAERTAGRRPRPPRRYIVAARPMPSRPVRCIQVANPTGLFLAGRAFIATHNSSFVKRLGLGLVAYGSRMLSLGDTKGEYTRLVEILDGQVIRVGRGLDRLNPLDSGPVGSLLRARGGQLPAKVRQELIDGSRAQRLLMLEVLCAIVRGRDLGEDERVLLGVALDRYAEVAGVTAEPTIGDIHRQLAVQDPDPALLASVHAVDTREYLSLVRPLLHTLELLLRGGLKGLFDGPSSRQLDPAAAAVSLDLSRLDDGEDTAVAVAMLCSWTWGAGLVDAARALDEQHVYFMVLDELWRALRATPGLVERVDRLTRLNRQRGVISAMITHSLDDLEAVAGEDGRAKARGLVARCGTLVLGALAPKELARLGEITPLAAGERALVTSWAAPPTWLAGDAHPGRGRYLLKSGERIGIPLRLDLLPQEAGLYDTDRAWHQQPATAADPAGALR